MAPASTPGHDRFRHGKMDVVNDVEQSSADVNEESSMTSWAQRLSRVVAGIFALVALVALTGAAPPTDSPCSLFASSVASSLFDFRPRPPCRQRAGVESCMSSHWAPDRSSTWSGAGAARVRAGAAGACCARSGSRSGSRSRCMGDAWEMHGRCGGVARE
eukprot:scaffold8437_cov39-Phaeocystis_antarctica.AAC.1